MTPKEKAFELAMKFEKLGETDNAKQCALIAVEQILELPFEFESERKYWQEVKQEIENL